MEHRPRTPWRHAVLGGEVVTLIGFVLYVALADSAQAVGAAVMVVGVVAVVTCAGGWLSQSPALPIATLSVVSALGLVGAVAYLHSLADEPSAIPLAGVGVLVLSLGGVVVSIALLARPEAATRLTR